MGIIAWIVFGFIVGVIARALMPGEQKMGFVKTTLLGVGGSFVGGAIAHVLLHRSHFGGLDTAGFVGSVIGALVIMGVAALLGRKR
ncbi:MAG: hypothetical protein A2138_08710 [Deltaproteobacteria bacterium RBG_16_71_12]|nr:MAG: hypothetical protein A2138_08710 [Deltaproteobacteria bacterium RBG_16_71_12]